MKNQIVASIAAIPFAVGALFAGATNAQALPTGSLVFQDGTSDFFSDVTPGSGDMFDVTFNLGSKVFVSTATGDFVPPFVGAFTTEELLTSTANFEYVSADGNMFTYKLTNDLVFDFDNGDNNGNESIVTWLAGTEFEGMYTQEGNSLEFSLAPNQQMAVVTGIGEDVTVIANALQFSDTEAVEGGGFTAQVDVTRSTPEPATLFGLGVVATGLVASRRKKSS